MWEALNGTLGAVGLIGLFVLFHGGRLRATVTTGANIGGGAARGLKGEVVCRVPFGGVF